MNTQQTSPSYHHGNLKQQLIDQALIQIGEAGIENLSLRQISEQIGVSRNAAYHHFKNKQALIHALAEHSFSQFKQTLTPNLQALDNVSQSKCYATELERLILAYFQYALEYPQQYNMLFGRHVWAKPPVPLQLKELAFYCFNRFAHTLSRVQTHLGVDEGEHLLNAKLLWSNLHGLSLFFIEGIYLDRNELTRSAKSLARSFINTAH